MKCVLLCLSEKGLSYLIHIAAEWREAVLLQKAGIGLFSGASSCFYTLQFLHEYKFTDFKILFTVIKMREGVSCFWYGMSQYCKCLLSLLFNWIAAWMLEYIIDLFKFIFLSDVILEFRGKDHHMILKKILKSSISVFTIDREALYKRGCLSCRHWKKKVSTKWWLFLFNALKLSLLAAYRLPLVVHVCLFLFEQFVLQK